MMKQIFILLFCVATMVSCKNETKPIEPEIDVNSPERTAKQSDGLTLLRGEFIYHDNAAVLQVGKSIFGVVVNDKMNELYEMGKPFRTESTDGISAEIRGKIIALPEGKDGWPFSVEIKEMINVKKLDPKQNEVVKIGK